MPLKLELTTPTRLVVSEVVDEVIAPGVEGYFGVWPGHAPLLTTLGAGELSYRVGAEVQRLAVNGGFAEVRDDEVIVLADTAERPEEIDAARAERAGARAEERLAGRSREAVDYTRATAALARARARLQVAGHHPT